MSTRIVWRTRGSDVEHTIPAMAIVTIEGNNGRTHSCWIASEGDIHFVENSDFPMYGCNNLDEYLGKLEMEMYNETT